MCMTLIAGRKATRTGRVLVGHNEDDYAFTSVRHGYVPHAFWEEGSVVPCENGCTEIPQVSETYGYYWMQVRNQKAGLCTADSFINENGVVVVSDSSCGSKEHERLKDVPFLGIVYSLRRVIAERAKSARHGLKVAMELLNKYGYASPGRIYTIADANEAFMLQVVRGHYYAALRIPDDAIAVMPNHYTIHTLNDAEEVYFSKDLVSHALECGFCESADTFDFAAAYQNTEMYRHPVNTLRHRHASEMLGVECGDAYPCFAKATRLVDHTDFQKVLATHYEGTCDEAHTGNAGSPHYTGVRTVCVGTTVESAVYELGDDIKNTLVYTAFSRPCELPYIPMHPLRGAVKAVDAMEYPAFEAANHHNAKPGAVTYRHDGWQKFTDFENALELCHNAQIDEFNKLKYALENELDAGKNERSDDETAAYALKALEGFAARRFTPVTLNAEIKGGSKGETLTLKACFKPEKAVDSESVYFLFGRSCFAETQNRAKLPLVSLGKARDGMVPAEVIFENSPLYGADAGEYELYISGKYTDGTAFYGMTVINAEE